MKVRQITVLVFGALPEKEVTLDCPEIRRSPKETVEEFLRHIEETEYVVVRTYTDPIINYIGEMIYNKEISSDIVRVVQPDGVKAWYNEESFLENWTYGLFNYGDSGYSRNAE